MEHIRTNKVKLIASQARTVNLYKNLRSKLLKCCANIYFNRQCLNKKKIIPKYVNIKVANTSPAARTTKKAQLIRIKEEIRMLYKKKDNLNRDLYRVHLQAAKAEWILHKGYRCVRQKRLYFVCFNMEHIGTNKVKLLHSSPALSFFVTGDKNKLVYQKIKIRHTIFHIPCLPLQRKQVVLDYFPQNLSFLLCTAEQSDSLWKLRMAKCSVWTLILKTSYVCFLQDVS